MSTEAVDAFNAAGDGVLVPWGLVEAFDGDYLCAVAYKRLLWRWRQGGGVEREGQHWVAASWVDVAKDLHVNPGQARRAMEWLCEKGALIKGGPWRFGMSPVNHYRPDLDRLAEYANGLAESDESIRSETREDSLKNANHRQSSTSEQYSKNTNGARNQSPLFDEGAGARDDGRPKEDPDYGFDSFWETYPARKGRKLNKEKARSFWRKLKLDDKRAAWRGAKNLSIAIDAGDHIAPDAFRWLRDRSWLDWLETVEPNGHRPPQPNPNAVWSDYSNAWVS